MTDEEHFNSLRKYFPWMSDDQWSCYELLAELYRGAHHVSSKKIKAWGDGIKYSHYGELSTFDFDNLTRLVRLAHQQCIRATIGPSGPGMISIILHKRHSREGRMYEKHPSWEDVCSKQPPVGEVEK